MSTVKVLVHESFELDGVCTWPSWSVHSGIAIWLGGELWKNEIRGFWDLRVGKAYKCPRMNTMKFLVHESFEFGGVCTWPKLSMHHGIARLLGGEFREKMKFVVFEIWGLERPTNVPQWIPLNSLCTKVLSSEGFEHGQGWRCTTAKVWLGVLFCEKMKFLVFEMWGLERLTNDPKWIPWNSWCMKFWVRRGLHLAKVVGAPRHS